MEDATKHPRVKPAGGIRRGPALTPYAVNLGYLIAGFLLGVLYGR